MAIFESFRADKPAKRGKKCNKRGTCHAPKKPKGTIHVQTKWGI